MNDIISKQSEVKMCHFCNENSNLDRGFFNLKSNLKRYDGKDNMNNVGNEMVIFCKCMKIAHKSCLLKKIITSRTLKCNKCKYDYLIEIIPQNWSLLKTILNKEVIFSFIFTLAMILFLILSIVTEFQEIYFFYHNLLIVLFSILVAIFITSLAYIIRSYYSYSYIYKLKFLFEVESLKNTDTKEINKLIEEKYNLIPKNSFSLENDDEEINKINIEVDPKLSSIFKYFMDILSMHEQEIIKNSVDSNDYQKICVQRKQKFGNILKANINESYKSITKTLKLDFKNLQLISSINPDIKQAPKNSVYVNVDVKNTKINQENEKEADNVNLNLNNKLGRLSDVKELMLENIEKTTLTKPKDKSIKFLPIISKNSKKQVTSFYNNNDTKNKSISKDMIPITRQNDNSDTNHISKSLISPTNKKEMNKLQSNFKEDKKDNNNFLDTSSIIQENDKKKFSFTDSEVESIMLSHRNENPRKFNTNTINTLENISNLDYLNSEENLLEK